MPRCVVWTKQLLNMLQQIILVGLKGDLRNDPNTVEELRRKEKVEKGKLYYVVTFGWSTWLFSKCLSQGRCQRGESGGSGEADRSQGVFWDVGQNEHRGQRALWGGCQDWLWGSVKRQRFWVQMCHHMILLDSKNRKKGSPGQSWNLLNANVSSFERASTFYTLYTFYTWLLWIGPPVMWCEIRSA